MPTITKDKAKLLLTEYGMRELMLASRPMSARDILGTIPDVYGLTNLGDTEIIAHVAKQKAWQRSVLDRLLEFRLIAREPISAAQHGFTAKNRDLLARILEEPKEQTLRWLVFPQDYEPSPALRDYFITEEEPEEPAPPALPPAESGNGKLVPPPEEPSVFEETLVQLLQGVGELHREVKELRAERKVMTDALTLIAVTLQDHHKSVAACFEAASSAQSVMHHQLRNAGIQVDARLVRIEKQMAVRDLLAHVYAQLKDQLTQGGDMKAALELLMDRTGDEEGTTRPK